jgi:hypothetical protein
VTARRPDEVIEFHRGGGRGIALPLVFGALLVAFGAFLVLGSLTLFRRDLPLKSATFAGIMAILAAPAVVLGGLFRRAVGEACVSLRRDGVQLEQDGETTFVAWADVEDARATDGSVELVRAHDKPLKIDAGLPDPAAFAARVLELRRKASFNVL